MRVERNSSSRSHRGFQRAFNKDAPLTPFGIIDFIPVIRHRGGVVAALFNVGSPPRRPRRDLSASHVPDREMLGVQFITSVNRV
jgi:hypothetical protein